MSGRSAVAGVLALALLGTLAACTGASDGGAKASHNRDADVSDEASFEPAAEASPSVSPSPLREVPPASTAGGLCRKLNYDRVASAIGVRFEVAAASGEAGAEQVCVLQRIGFSAPDLTLSRMPVEPPADIEGAAGAETDVEAFRADYQPESAKTVTGLGKAAYSRVVAGESGDGAQIEVGWLGKQTVYVLTLTTTPATNVTAAAKEVPRVVGLARQLAL